jgi:hypothetical protein
MAFNLLNENLFWGKDSKVSSPAWIRWLNSLCIKKENLQIGDITITSAPAAPTTGTWKKGDVCFNSSPSSGHPAGWSCTVSGTTGGTWQAWANL